MPRLRQERPGAVYHVIARGVDRRRIFVDPDDYRTYERLLATVSLRQRWSLLCYSLMPNHVHLLIELPEANLANGMQWLQSRYARYFNDRYDRAGHLFEAPYLSPEVTTDAALVRTVGYIAVNPVAAALAPSAVAWPFGSHAVLRRHRFVPRWLHHKRLLELVHRATGTRDYDRLVATAERRHRREARRTRRKDPALSARMSKLS